MLARLLALAVSAVGVVGFAVAQHKRRYPEKSYAIALLNTLLTPLRLLKLGPYKHGEPNLEATMNVVSKELGLTDFGDLSFVRAYDVIRSQPQFREQRFSNLGAMVASMEYRMMLVRRLGLTQLLKTTPSIEAVPVPAPIFVFGLGRSGTTFLHRLLSLDPRTRSPLLWELASPVPDLSLDGQSSPAALAADRAKRMEFIRRRVEERKVMGDDGLEKFHEVGHDLPEECLHILADELPTLVHYLFASITHWRQLAQALPADDFVRAFRWEKKILQTLSWQTGEVTGARRWVLKCPLHIFMIRHLAETFPDAKLVWAHRHPVPTVSSLCSLLGAMRGIYYTDPLDKAALGRTVLRVGADGIAQAQADIQATGLPCAHVLFENLTADPVRQVQQVYEQLGLEFTAEYEAILKAFLEKDRQKRAALAAKLSKGQTTKLHDHKPEDYGLTREQLTTGVFNDYINTFGITSTK